MSAQPEKRCPICLTACDDFTAIVHEAVHRHRRAEAWNRLENVPPEALPALGKLLRDFGVKLLEWLKTQSAKGHLCVLEQCAHANKAECLRQLVADCARDLREQK